MADLRVRPTSPGPPDSGIVLRPESDQRPASGKTHSPDDYLLIERLREDAAAGRMDLDSILSEATHAARYFTDAKGAALALWSQGVVICRARSGDTAPPLGAKLDVDSGISGECLRTGRSKRCNDTLTDPLVDSQVCQELGIRSLAAVPLRGEHGVVGILEIFSDRPYAFSDAHITMLKQLAQIAVTGRSKSAPASTPTLKQSVDFAPFTVAPTVESKVPKLPKISLQLLAAKMKGEEGQRYRMAAAGAVLLALVVGFGWMISRGRSGNSSNHAPRSVQAASAAPSAVAATAETTITVTPTSSDKAQLLKLAIPKPKPASAIDVVAGNVVHRASSAEVTSRNSAPNATNSTPGSGAEAAAAKPNPPVEDVQAPTLETLASSTPQSATIPQSLLAGQPKLPSYELRTSQGVTGGVLTHRVSPSYPSQARIQRIEGTVVLEALVGEDGNVHNVKVTSGPAVLSGAAKEAVEQWRYQPFQLNGKPVQMSTSIKIVFKLP
jgi:TonB family protein